MNEIGEQLLEKLCASLPGSKVYWEKEPTETSLDKSVLTAEHNNRKFTMQFECVAGSEPGAAPDPALVEEVVDDFVDFFSRTIYPKEKFTRII